jgi:ubiquinone/menaquinone biosynthesis C-methylase UbiE
MKTPTKRFSDRVDNYLRYRPAYPEAVVDALTEKCRLDENSVVADVGSGTGIFTRLLLEKGLRVIAIEPNQEMREAAEALLSGEERFTSVDGSAEESNLADISVDVIVAAQAFHWFRRDETQREFARILKSTGWLALVWNQRKLQQPFQQEYDALLREHAPEYNLVNHMNISGDEIAKIFASAGYQKFVFENSQVFDKAGFLGRMQSSSYTPPVNTSEYPKLMESAGQLFAQYEESGTISFEYDTRLYVGKLTSSDECAPGEGTNPAIDL